MFGATEECPMPNRSMIELSSATRRVRHRFPIDIDGFSAKALAAPSQ